MNPEAMGRRDFIKTAGIGSGIALGTLPIGKGILNDAVAAPTSGKETSTMKLGMVTYNMGKDMDCDALIALCMATGVAGVELRTTHAHKVETDLNAEQRTAVRLKFEQSGIAIAGIGTAFEYHSNNPTELEKNITGSIAYAQLAADVGAPGIKVRPNGIPRGENPEITLERIGKAWGRVATAAANLGVEVWMEVHGAAETRSLPNIRKMLDYADHPNAKVCWNSNAGEADENGSIRSNFELVKHAIGEVHITEIGVYQYPWQELFLLLAEIGYSGYCLAEIQYNPEPERFMRYYRTLFDLYTGQYRYPNPELYAKA